MQGCGADPKIENFHSHTHTHAHKPIFNYNLKLIFRWKTVINLHFGDLFMFNNKLVAFYV